MRWLGRWPRKGSREQEQLVPTAWRQPEPRLALLSPSICLPWLQAPPPPARARPALPFVYLLFLSPVSRAALPVSPSLLLLLGQTPQEQGPPSPSCTVQTQLAPPPRSVQGPRGRSSSPGQWKRNTGGGKRAARPVVGRGRVPVLLSRSQWAEPRCPTLIGLAGDTHVRVPSGLHPRHGLTL